MATLQINATNVFHRNYQAIQQGKRILCNAGGSRSSKTWSIFQLLLIRATEGKKETYTIARKHSTWLKDTLLVDFAEITDKYKIKVTPEISIRRPDQQYDVNGTTFAFFGLDDPKRVHGRKQDGFWLNEVMEIGRSTFDQLEQRTTKFGILDYNPYDDQHWVFDLYKRDDVAVITSTMLDNAENLEKSILKKIMSYRPDAENIRQGTADQYMWDVYGLGKQAQLKGLVFDANKWDIVDSIPENARDIGIGMDFGFANDPTAIVELYLLDNEIYLNELCYEPKLVNVSTIGEKSIDDILRQLQIGRREITADSSEPKSITELYNKGWNITGAVKGQDSVRFGIDLLKKYKLHITRKSINIEKELRKYKYHEDKDGRLYNEPVDAFNHAIDAIRYRAMAKLGNVYEARTLNARALGL